MEPYGSITGIKIMDEEVPINNKGNNSTIPKPITNEHWPFFVTLVSISAICLFITVILYLLIREKHNCRGWTQFSYLLSLLLFFIVFIPALCPGLTKGTERNMICMSLSVSNQYFFVSSKMWLIIISLDMYCAIRKPKAIVQNSAKSLFPKFVLYSVFGWIFPAMFVVSGVILNWKNRKKLLMKLVNNDGLWTAIPDYGFLHCRIPAWIAWECFVFGNCIFHFLMFGLIGFTICYQRTRFTTTDSSRSTRKKQSSLALLVRLFVVVGLSWSYIAIQDLLHAGNINTTQTWIWHVFRSVFFLQGVFISTIIITNGHTWALLKLKYPKLKACSYNIQKFWRNLKTISLSILKCGKISSDERKESIQSITSQCTIETT